MAFDKIVGVDGTTYQFPSVVRQRIADNIETVGSVENLAVIDALGPALALKSNTTHNHTLASLTSNGIDELGDVEIGVVGSNGIALADKHTLQYESSTSRWRNKVASGGVTVSDSRPLTPIAGDAWFDSNDGTLYVFYVDANTSQWVQVQANSALEGTILARLGALEGRATALEAVPDYSPNYIINGAFDINQRNFTSTTTNGTFGHDRWSLETASGTVTYSTQAFTAGTVLGTDEPTNFARIITTGQSGTTALTIFRQKMEDVRLLAGKTVTVSFWAKAASGAPKITAEINQSYGTGGSPSNNDNYLAGQVTLSTTWARYSVTTNLPSNSGKTFGTAANSSFTQLSLWLSAGTDFNARTSSLGIQSNTFDIWGVQIEEGSVATPFHRNSNSVEGELASCQRYYQVIASGNDCFFATGHGFSTVSVFASYIFPVQLRSSTTTVTISSPAHFRTYSANGSGIAFSTFSVQSVTPQSMRIDGNVSSGLTVGQGAVLSTQSASAFFAIASEL